MGIVPRWTWSGIEVIIRLQDNKVLLSTRLPVDKPAEKWQPVTECGPILDAGARALMLLSKLGELQILRSFARPWDLGWTREITQTSRTESTRRADVPTYLNLEAQGSIAASSLLL